VELTPVRYVGFNNDLPIRMRVLEGILKGYYSVCDNIEDLLTVKCLGSNEELRISRHRTTTLDRHVTAIAHRTILNLNSMKTRAI
jgi:hypothetical protein